MRAGALDRTLTIERATFAVDAAGTPVATWAAIATVRAQKLQSSTEEFMRSFGEAAETVAIFRIRWLGGISVTDRVTCDGIVYDLKEAKELGRREGLDLRCVKAGTA
ncbi:head-tail adaptor protein [Frigidibacter oleivorans]|uniref:head-tail adaptor protein n=1 Tax=Frigidibacter oleivorans TaxID=2487129 RepID=UPI000F8E0003|nr:head-tail adaptor protein [Frigidibacter oleivorans]